MTHAATTSGKARELQMQSSAWWLIVSSTSWCSQASAIRRRPEQELAQSVGVGRLRAGGNSIAVVNATAMGSFMVGRGVGREEECGETGRGRRGGTARDG